MDCDVRIERLGDVLAAAERDPHGQVIVAWRGNESFTLGSQMALRLGLPGLKVVVALIVERPNCPPIRQDRVAPLDF